MAKTDFSKVEKRLMEGLQKIFIERLLEMAKSAEIHGIQEETVEEKATGEKVIKTSKEASKEHIMKTLRADVEKLTNKEARMLKKLGLTKEQIEELVDNPDDLSEEDWKRLNAFKEELDKKKSKHLPTKSSGNNEDIVEEERVKHINKRFNIRDGWLPLK